MVGGLTRAPAGDAAAVVAELDLLLTGNRLADVAAVEAAYSAAPNASAALAAAVQLVAASREFHASNLNAPADAPAPPVAPIEGLGRAYKAIVVLFLNGGCDSSNLLVPHSGCVEPHDDGVDLYEQYASVRTNLALDQSELLEIEVPPENGQPCTPHRAPCRPRPRDC